jgi:PAS domain S-box-containing protein
MSQIQRTVLIIEDSKEDCELYKRYLRQQEDFYYNFIETELGQSGLELYRRYQPELILLDYQLPDLEGLEFLKQLQTQTQQSLLPVIIVTGAENEAIAAQGLKAGAQDYLIKGQISPEKLLLTIERTIERVQLQLQLQQRIKSEQIIAQITQQIYQSLDLERILQTTVDLVRQFLKTDRVLIFRFAPDGDGTVVAESVGSGWRSLLNAKIQDLCLVEAEIDRYRQGQIGSYLEDAAIAPGDCPKLTQLQVRANLVVPILSENQLWGLLIAHHCQAPRLWQPLEIDLLQHLTTHIAIAIRQTELDRGIPRFSPDGSLTGYIGSCIEIDNRKQTEEALRTSEEFKQRILESSSDCIKLLDLNGLLLYMNEGGMSLMEIEDLTPLLNTEWVSFWQGETYAAAQNAIAKAKAGEVGKFQGWCLTAKGTPKCWDVLITPILDINRQVIQLLAVSRDMTDRKRTEQALRESEAQFRTLADNMSQFAWMADRTGWLFWYNRRWLEYTGTTLEEMQGWGWQKVHHPEHIDRVVEHFSHCLETGEQWEDTFLLKGKDGNYRWFLSRAIPIRDEQGEIACWFGTNTDIEDRKQIEEALRQSEERYRCLAELIPQLVWTTNSEGTILDVNQRWSEYTGLTLAEVQSQGWEIIVYPDDLPVISQQWAAALQTETYYQAEGRIRGADGTYRWHLHQAIPQKNEQGQIIKWFGTATDIETQKQLEKERDRLLQLEQSARLAAEQANRVKDEFLAILSHELRSPLNPILGWTQLMQSPKFDSTRIAEGLAVIERNAKLQTQLIDDLLDVAKILRGKLNLKITPVNLKVAIKQAIETVKTAAISKSIAITPILANIGLVSGDYARIQQIIWNLLSNAIKFTPHRGRVEIRLEQVGNRAKITVTDSGKGIKPDFLPYIFESFRQEDLSISRKHGGLGLGLSIVRYLVEAHEGKVFADSLGEGQGATFTVELPLLEVEPTTNQTERLPDPNIDLTGIRILTIDDNPDACLILNLSLSQCGAEVVTVASADEFWQSLASFQPHLSISDIGMPEVDGYTLIQQLRSLPPEQGGQIPAIALTAYVGEIEQQKAMAVGFQLHLAKPIALSQLIQAVAKLVHQSRQNISSEKK